MLLKEVNYLNKEKNLVKLIGVDIHRLSLGNDQCSFFITT